MPVDDARVWTRIPSPVGDLVARAEGGRLVALEFTDEHRDERMPEGRHDPGDAVLARLAAELGEYFARRRTQFGVPLAPAGTPFQQRVWAALLAIPYGRTESYGALARRIGQPAAVRAVGLANGRNPVAILIPCHRVIGADGSLTGYGGGLWRKRLLLELEGADPASTRQRALALA